MTESNEVLEAFIARQKDRVDQLKYDVQNVIQEYHVEVARLCEAQRNFNKTVENKAAAFFAQLE
ncbi:hypothetical protein [Halocatena pleomorpha]|uniref:Uncharacterized protein n=1 Tax=Halocatena pleomorpha TaxID=1785090 RepID=A0A3P3R9A0_9EURY|nr:hypothetical protein [Halocatena pleomorpha]RRJ29509.1 hypothetical protein EIK79_12795 [Halocatena pleomorpha]